MQVHHVYSVKSYHYHFTYICLPLDYFRQKHHFKTFITLTVYIRRGFPTSFVSYKKGCTRLANASNKVYQLLAQDRWFSPGTPASSTTKTGRHDIAESGVKHRKPINQSTDSIHCYKRQTIEYTIQVKGQVQQINKVTLWLPN